LLVWNWLFIIIDISSWSPVLYSYFQIYLRIYSPSISTSKYIPPKTCLWHWSCSWHPVSGEKFMWMWVKKKTSHLPLEWKQGKCYKPPSGAKRACCPGKWLGKKARKSVASQCGWPTLSPFFPQQTKLVKVWVVVVIVIPAVLVVLIQLAWVNCFYFANSSREAWKNSTKRNPNHRRALNNFQLPQNIGLTCRALYFRLACKKRREPRKKQWQTKGM